MSSGDFEILITAKHELQLATGIIAGCHNWAFSSSKKCVWPSGRSVQGRSPEKKSRAAIVRSTLCLSFSIYIFSFLFQKLIVVVGYCTDSLCTLFWNESL